MKLLFDAMLRNTAKWARLFGVDSEYTTKEDQDILEYASKSGRILITMDKELSERAKKRGINTVFLSAFDVPEQLHYIEKELKQEIFGYPDKTRCTVCNGKLKAAKPEDIKSEIPEKVAVFQKEFWICEDCGKIYWEGGHWKNIIKTYEELKEKRAK